MYNKLFQLLFFLSYKIKTCFQKKARHPLIASFKITKKCNLKCIHCPFWQIKNKNIQLKNYKQISNDDNLDFYQIKSILNKLKNDGVKIIVFEGGEPLLWKDLKNNKIINDVINYSKKLFFITAITTNGTIDFSNINSDIVFISLDGLKETHDKIRGESYEKIIQNIYKNSNKKIIVNICISKANIFEVENIIKFLNDKVFGITIQFFYPFKGLPDLLISYQDRIEIINKILELKNKKFKILNSKDCLLKMKNNNWKCYDFLVASVESNGKISYGCYLKNKVENISCKHCGFTVHCELSLAYNVNIYALLNAKKIFWDSL